MENIGRAGPVGHPSADVEQVVGCVSELKGKSELSI